MKICIPREKKKKVLCEVYGISVPKTFTTDGYRSCHLSNLYGFQKVFSFMAGITGVLISP